MVKLGGRCCLYAELAFAIRKVGDYHRLVVRGLVAVLYPVHTVAFVEALLGATWVKSLGAKFTQGCLPKFGCSETSSSSR